MIQGMSFRDILKNSIIREFQAEKFDMAALGGALLFSLIVALYLYVVYRFWVRKSLYNANMNISLVGMTITTTAIMLTIQSNLVLSLGMVGALSIVRYRTAIKDPMDLFFLFWAIAGGIMCGAEQYVLAVTVSLCLTLAVILLSYIPVKKAPYVMVINGSKPEIEEGVQELLKSNCGYFQIKSRSLAKGEIRMIVELRTRQEKDLLAAIGTLEGVERVSLLTYAGDVIG